MKQRLFLTGIAGLAFGLCFAGNLCGSEWRVVGVSVADVRKKPGTATRAGLHDQDQETQLIYGEKVAVLKVESGWAKIQAVEQQEYTHRRFWEGYPGWVKASCLLPPRKEDKTDTVVVAKWADLWKDAYKAKPLGIKLPMGSWITAKDMGGQLWQVRLADGTVAWMDYPAAVSKQSLSGLNTRQKRAALIASAQKLIGDAYYWGGRSPQDDSQKNQITGVDCSGLINLSFRTIGMAVARDAHEQYLKARPVKQLQPGDLIFLSEPANPKRIVHVMLYAGNGELLEGPGTGETIRRITVAKRLGKPMEQLKPNDVIGGQTLFFGSLLE